MSEQKSKMPDLKELASMTGKLFNDIKTSVGQIIHDYKAQREQPPTEVEPTVQVKPEAPKPVVTPPIKPEEPPEVKK